MSIYTPNASGNFNTAGTWDTVLSPGTVSTTVDISALTTGVSSTNFTAPNLINAITGVWVYVVTYPAAGRDLTAEVFLAGVATGSIATIVQTDMPVTAGWIYFKLGTPLVFASLVASTYKWVFSSTTANSGTLAADNTSTTLVFPLTTYDAHTIPTTTDQIFIGPPNCTIAITVTVDGTTGDVRGTTQASGVKSPRTQGLVLWLGGSLTDSKSILKWDTAATSSLSLLGEVFVSDGGEIQMGTVATPYPSSKVATYTQRSSGGTTCTLSQIGTGRIIMQGAPLTYYNTTYVSGTGVAASPLVVADAVAWSVNDEIVITATSANGTNYQETETKFIKTVNSATSYVLSNTAGGAEVAFTYTHNTNAKVLNITRNVIFAPAGQALSNIQVASAVSGNINFDWVRFSQLGGGTAPATTISISNAYAGLYIASGFCGIDYCVFRTTVHYGPMIRSLDAQTYIGNIFTAAGAGGASTTEGQLGIDGVGHTFTDHYFVGNQRLGVEYRGANCTFINPHFSGNNTAGTALQGALYIAGGAPLTISSANIHANRISGVAGGGSGNVTFTNCEIGTKGINGADLSIVTSTANDILFDNCNVGSSTTVTNYLNGASGGTLIKFHRLNQTANNHRWYTELGSAQTTGLGLADTTVRTSGTLNVRIAPESLTGFKWEFKILAVPGKACSVLGFIERNAAFAASDCLVELFLPTSTVADSSQTMGTTVGSYLVFNLAAVYSGTESLYATCRITAKSSTAAAYIYVADIFNGTNNITNLNTWDQGRPSSIMFEQLGDASAVWAVATSTLTTPGTTGYKLTNLSGGGGSGGTALVLG